MLPPDCATDGRLRVGGDIRAPSLFILGGLHTAHSPATSKYCPLPPMTSTQDTPCCAASAGSFTMKGVMGSRAPDTSSC